MDECDPGAPLDMVAEVSTRRYDDFTHGAFVQKLHQSGDLVALCRGSACFHKGQKCIGQSFYFR